MVIVSVIDIDTIKSLTDCLCSITAMRVGLNNSKDVGSIPIKNNYNSNSKISINLSFSFLSFNFLDILSIIISSSFD